MVTFETKVWEKDWKYLLSNDYLEQLIDRCNYPFKRKTLVINNVKNKSLVRTYAENKKQKGVIDDYYFVEDYAEEVLKYFGLEKDSFKGGYNYSIAELTGIYLCRTSFLLHFSSDSFLCNDNIRWIDEAIKIFQERNDIIVANPTWNNSFDESKNESFDEIDNFYLGQGFSDQCYLIRMDIFKKKMYNEYNILSDRYPKYGGELFEKRVDSFMRNHNLYRITSKEKSYIHKNFPKNIFSNRINFFSNIVSNSRMKKF